MNHEGSISRVYVCPAAHDLGATSVPLLNSLKVLGTKAAWVGEIQAQRRDQGQVGRKRAAEVDVASLNATYLTLRKAAVRPTVLEISDLSMQSNVKPVRSLTEPLPVGMDNGARRALIPIENKRQFLDVSPDILERVDPIFFGDLREAAFKALGLAG